MAMALCGRPSILHLTQKAYETRRFRESFTLLKAIQFQSPRSHISSANAIVKPDTRLWIGGKFTASVSKNPLDPMILVNPSTGQDLPWPIHTAGDEDVDMAVQAAKIALKNTWGTYTGRQRRDTMLSIATQLIQNKERIAYLEALQGGKPIGEALYDVDDIVETFRFFAGYADKLHGKMMHTDPAYSAWTIREPVGVASILTSFNYPISLTGWKLAPALATGCAILLKPHDATPLSCLLLAELCQKAGLPDGVFSVLPGGEACGRAIVSHPEITKISFTGSLQVGRKVMRSASESATIKPVTLELGGKSPIIVCQDVAQRGADLDRAVEEVATAFLANAGQNCCAGSRLYLHESLEKEFVQRLKARVEAIKIGPATDETYNFGPVINQQQFDKVKNWLHLARADGLKFLTGQQDYTGPGFFIRPTILYGMDESHPLAQHEIFGPVLCVMRPFRTLEEVIERANNSEYALAAGIFSHDTDAIHHLTRHLKAGTTWVNFYNICLPYMPFGGFKNSGFGKDLGEEALDEWTTTRSIVQLVRPP